MQTTYETLYQMKNLIRFHVFIQYANNVIHSNHVFRFKKYHLFFIAGGISLAEDSK